MDRNKLKALQIEIRFTEGGHICHEEGRLSDESLNTLIDLFESEIARVETEARKSELETLLHKDVCEVMCHWSDKCEKQGAICPIIRKRLKKLEALKGKEGQV